MSEKHNGKNPKPPGMLHHLCTFDDVTMKQEFRLQHLLSSCGDCCTKCNLSSTNTGCTNQLLQFFTWTVSIRLTSHFSQGTLAHWYLLTWSVCKQLFYMRINVCFSLIAHTAVQSCALIKSCFSFQASLLGSRPSRPTWSTAVKAGYAATRRRWEPSIIHTLPKCLVILYVIDGLLFCLSWLKPLKASSKTK